MEDLINNATIGLRCKNCGHVTDKTVGWVKNHTEFVCACGARITLDTEEFIRDADKLRLFDGKLKVEYE